MSRFYIKPENVKDGKIFVDSEEAHHILDVMRLKEKNEVTAFDGKGHEYRGIISKVAKKSLEINIIDTSTRKSAQRFAITLAQALPRKEKMDYIIEKATELGVGSIIPMNTKRTVVRPDSKKIKSKIDRWERIAREAAKQCGRVSLVKIDENLDFEEVIKKAGSYDLAVMPSTEYTEKESNKKILENFKGKNILVIIGPEGGFDPSEVGLARKNNVSLVSLGENTLKCDTAALTTLAIINYALGDI